MASYSEVREEIFDGIRSLASGADEQTCANFHGRLVSLLGQVPGGKAVPVVSTMAQKASGLVALLGPLCAKEQAASAASFDLGAVATEFAQLAVVLGLTGPEEPPI